VSNTELVFSAARLLAPDPASGRSAIVVQVANNGSDVAHVWASPTVISYDDGTQTLNVVLAYTEPQDGFEPTQHPRIPDQLVVGPGEERELRIEFPPVLRRWDFAAPGLAPALAETPVGPIKTMHLEIAYAATPFQPLASLPPREYAAELAAHGGRITTDLPVTTEEGNN
jgi:hypothetical protein